MRPVPGYVEYDARTLTAVFEVVYALGYGRQAERPLRLASLAKHPVVRERLAQMGAA
jgi:hypothetical protein